MSNPEDISVIMKKIKKKWDTDPENWSVLGNVDKDGNREMLISQQPNSYWLKMRTLTSQSNMAYGKELTKIDDEINFKLNEGKKAKSISSKEELLQLFGMMVPDNRKKDLIYMSGVEKYSPEQMAHQKEKIEEKNPEADKLYRLYLQKKWEREQALREGMYM
ncbi:hypothetical protein NEF87_004561 [Candidatus Lokiarchaeum ossiferum]|uniref:Uncharacterized protein n=1 Tax=Candidatus Lokiarchaeum ossiferum TaxID=2951803 RepID=A0ABY6HY52_9ARCH|nr:hypothetical protein NEF87_004561 [Candidatus Lokiarchaeum sp. B-35]